MARVPPLGSPRDRGMEGGSVATGNGRRGHSRLPLISAPTTGAWRGVFLAVRNTLTGPSTLVFVAPPNPGRYRGTQKKGRPEAALRLIKFVVRSGEGRDRSLASPKARVSETREADQQHGPGRRLRDPGGELRRPYASQDIVELEGVRGRTHDHAIEERQRPNHDVAVRGIVRLAAIREHRRLDVDTADRRHGGVPVEELQQVVRVDRTPIEAEGCS